MNRNLKLVLFAVVVFAVVLTLTRMLRPAPAPEDTGETEAIVSKLIANDPLIAPASAGPGSATAR
ncbi:MAG: hypothetical protein HOP16_12860 [Acidobacteria bacterium]|nr:hypothetical protein [Acidobacteriota bacterium]